jgi:hypothetical protein
MRTLILLSFVLVLAGCRNKAPEKTNPAESKKPARVASPKAMPETGSLPDSNLTPGATLDVTKDDICTPGYAKKVRDVPTSVKRQVYTKYNIPYTPSQYEVDHLISLQLGGSNSIRNLWPESYNIYWNAHVKDALENRLHSLVCNGSLSMEAAQKAISTNWIEAYKTYFHTDIPLVGQNRKPQDRSERKTYR